MHHLVAAYLQYKPAPKRQPDADTSDDDPGWLQQSMTATPGPQAARDAQTTAEAIAAFERHFFGEVKDVEQL